MSVEYTVLCDECGSIIDASYESFAAARRASIAAGIMRRVKRKDVCRSCDKDAARG